MPWKSTSNMYLWTSLILGLGKTTLSRSQICSKCGSILFHPHTLCFLLLLLQTLFFQPFSKSLPNEVTQADFFVKIHVSFKFNTGEFLINFVREVDTQFAHIFFMAKLLSLQGYILFSQVTCVMCYLYYYDKR